MKIASVNIDTGVRDKIDQISFHTWIDSVRPDLLLLQESCTFEYGTNGAKDVYGDPLQVAGYVHLKQSSGLPERESRVAAYAKSAHSTLDVTQRDQRWQTIRVSTYVIHNVYFPIEKEKSEPSKTRRWYLNGLVEAVSGGD